MNYIYELPVEITLDDKVFKIRNKGDYRLILDIIIMLNDPDLTEEEKVICIVEMFYEDYQSIFKDEKLIEKSISEAYKFIDLGEDFKPSSPKPILMDWEQDAQLIVPAINRIAGTEVRALPYLHWWTFIGYYNEIGECSFSTVVSIRNKQKKGKKLDNWEKDYIKENREMVTLKPKLCKEERDELNDILGI